MIKKLNFTRPLKVIFSGIVLALIAICIIVGRSQWKDISHSYHKNNETHLDNISFLIEETFNNYEYALKGVAKSNSEMLIDTDEKRTVLKRRLMNQLRTIPHVISIGEGDMLGNYLQVPFWREKEKEYDPRNREWFQNTLANSNEVAYTAPYKDFTSNKRIISLSLPIINEESKTTGVVAFDVDFLFFEKLFDHIKHPVEGSVIVMSDKGEPIIGEGALRKQETAKSIFDTIHSNEGYFHHEETQSYYYYKNITKPDWIIFYKVNATALDDLIFNETIRVVYITIFAIIIALFSWWAVNARINNIYVSIANSLRAGKVLNKKASDLLIDEIKHNADQIETIKEETLLDGLTGLHNRRAFDEDLKKLKGFAPGAVAIIDIDNFKSINDSYGHTTGDLVLKTIAELSKRYESDQVSIYRYGGEEMAVIFKAMEQKDALKILEAWRAAAEKRKYRENGLQVTFSGGLCFLDECSPEEALETADTRLYQAKNAGKNCIISSDT